MKRRTFLSTIPGVIGLIGAEGSQRTARELELSVITVGSIHTRVERSIEDLAKRLRAMNYRTNREKESGIRSAAGNRIVICVADAQNLSLLKSLGLPSPRLAPEQFELRANRGLLLVVGGDSRGLAYGLSHLSRLIDFDGSLPASLNIKKQPAFPVRRWSAAVAYSFGSPWDERVHIAQRFAYIKSEIFPRAIDYGMNSIELYGRPADGWDIDWVVSFEKYPELAALLPAGERRERLALVEDLARSAHDHLLEILVWSHELHLPPGFLDLYPQARGQDYPVCLSSDFLKQFVRDKYREFFKAVPSVQGVVVSVNESGEFSLLTDRGCQCDKCLRLKPEDRLKVILDEVVAVALEFKKQIILRTFQSSWIRDLNGHPELNTIRKAYTGLAPSVQIMSKYCPLDFYGGAIADEPLIGAFPNPCLVEFSLDVEWQGRTFIPALTPGNFRRRVEHGIKKGCVGMVGRIDFPFPTMEPEPIWGHPNEFNAWYFSELLWNPDAKIDDTLRQWAQIRYAPKASRHLSSAFRKTEAITQKTFFALGQNLINYHNMLPSVSFCDDGLWNFALSKWDPNKKALSEAFFQPDDDLIARTQEEKKEAIELATRALVEINQTRGSLPEIEFQRLRYGFEKLRDTANLWDRLLQLYLRHRQVASSPVKPELLRAALEERDYPPLQHLLAAAKDALAKAVDMEGRHGKNSWPVVSPDRGVSVYEFVNQILRHYFAFFTGEEAGEKVTAHRDDDQVVTAPVYQPGSIESFWRALIEQGRPGFEIGSQARVSVKWPVELAEVRLNGLDFVLTNRDQKSMRFPLSYRVGPARLTPEPNNTFLIRKTPNQLLIENVGRHAASSMEKETL